MEFFPIIFFVGTQILHMQIGNDTIFYPESNQLKHLNFFLKIIITWIILQYSIQSHTYRKETIFFLGESTMLPLGCHRMFKLVNQCWPQVFLVKYTHRMWGNQKYLDFFWYLHLPKGLLLVITMIGNGKSEPFTLWNDIELIYRITASQWTS